MEQFYPKIFFTEIRLILWHINHDRLFNAKYSLYMFMICKQILLITFLNKPELIFAHS